MTAGLRKQRRYSAKASSENRAGAPRRIGRSGGVSHHVTEKELRIRADEPLGKAPGLGEEVPVIAPHRRVAVDARELVIPSARCRGPRACATRAAVVERHAIGDPPPAVVPGHEERGSPSRCITVQLIGGHRALAVGPAVVGVGGCVLSP